MAVLDKGPVNKGAGHGSNKEQGLGTRAARLACLGNTDQGSPAVKIPRGFEEIPT